MKNGAIYNVVLEGITYETRAILESMCYGGLCSLIVDDMWDLFEHLASYQWQCKSANESFVCPSPPPYGFHPQSSCVDQLKHLCHHYYSYPHVICSYCQSFDCEQQKCFHCQMS